jgi:steroid delta-isomerase-like uncharacterized protein
MSGLAEELVAALAGRDRGRVHELCDPHVHWEDPLARTPVEGAVALGDHLARLWAAVPDLAAQLAAPVLADGERVAVPVRLTGTHAGETGELPPTGRSLTVEAVVWCEAHDGRLWRARAFFDVYAAAQQLGILPPHGGVGERALFLLRGFGLRG